MEQQLCVYGCGNPVIKHDGKGRTGKYFHPNCRKCAQRQRDANNKATKIEMNVTKLRDTILHGDALAILRQLPDQCVQCCVTSPPYWNLRDYGVPGQIGLEQTPQDFIEKLVSVFGEVRRVLRDDGVLWLNLGDTYANDNKWGGATSGKHGSALHGTNATSDRRTTGLAPKNLVGIPWRVAFALQDDGWILRSDVIWHKPTAMPESVLDRPTSAHEHVFLFAKKKHYYYDADAIREPLAAKTFTTFGTKHRPQGNDALGLVKSDNWGSTVHERKPRLTGDGEIAGANKRNVWTVASQPFPGAHFAVMPEKLVEPCILAGSSPQACEHCGAPWQRITGKTGHVNKREPAHVPGNTATKTDNTGWVPSRLTTNQWEPTCTCSDNTGRGQCVILDPFAGSGTVLMVAKKQGRSYLGIELNHDYIRLAEDRLAGVPLSLWQEMSPEEVG